MLRTKHLQDLLVEHAQVDPLTGLPNRRALTERLHSEWARIQRHDGNLSFIMADVDHFKRINDTYGHNLGDAVLQEIAQSIFSQCRQVDMPARYGGDEFVILVPDEDAQARPAWPSAAAERSSSRRFPATARPSAPRPVSA